MEQKRGIVSKLLSTSLKTQKTPSKEIKKAEKIRKGYLDNKFIIK